MMIDLKNPTWRPHWPRVDLPSADRMGGPTRTMLIAAFTAKTTTACRLWAAWLRLHERVGGRWGVGCGVLPRPFSHITPPVLLAF